MQIKAQPAARARWVGAANFDYAGQPWSSGVLIQRASAETMKGLPCAMAHQNVFRTREGGGSKTSCNPKPTDQYHG